MSAPFVSSGDGDLGAAVVVITISLTIITLSVFLLRVYSTIRREKGFAWDDVALLFALVILIAQTVSVERAVANGLGKHIEEVGPSSLSLFFKWTYAGYILAIFAQFFAKISVLFLVGRIDPKALRHKAVLGLAAAILVWLIFSSFTIAFQCGFPRPWEFVSNECAADGRLLYVIIVLNILTDAGLAFFFLPTIWKLQMDTSTRKIAVALFASRSIVCAVSIAHAAVLHRFLTSADKTWTITPSTILSQFVINLSIITAIIPSTHRYFSGLYTGKMGINLKQHEIETTNSAHNSRNRSYGWSRTARSDLNSIRNDHKLSRQTSEKGLRLRPETHAEQMASVSAAPESELGTQPEGGTRQGSSGTDEADVQPEHGSTSSLKRNVVYQKREFFMDVEYENGHGNEQRQPSDPITQKNIS